MKMQKANWLSLLVFPILFQCQQDQKVEVTTYPNGQISRKTNLVNEKKDGLMHDFYSDGKLKSIRDFRNDLQHGRSLYYHQNGKLKEVQHYENGYLEQFDSIWNENGQLTTVTEYHKGLKNGKFVKFDTLGRIKFSAAYEMDTLIEVNGIPMAR